MANTFLGCTSYLACHNWILRICLNNAVSLYYYDGHLEKWTWQRDGEWEFTVCDTNNKQKILHTINFIYFLFILGQQIDTNIIFNPLILLQQIY